MRLLFSIALAASLTLVLSAAAGTAVDASSKVVDRTFVCTPQIAFGQMRDVDAEANPLYVSDGIRTPAHLVVGSGPSSPLSVLATVRAESWAFLNNTYPGGVYVSSSRCRATSASPRLAAKGLPGPPTVWAKAVECQVRGKVLVRVRAVLPAAKPWRKLDPRFVGVRTSVASAKLVVRSQATGEPVAYAELDGEKTKLWFSPGCT